MSVLFEHQGALVWDPSLRVATLFLRQIRAIEAALGIVSGLGEIESDEVAVDGEGLRAFVQAAADEIDGSDHGPLRSLLGGPFALAAGLFAACGADAGLQLGRTSTMLYRRGADILAGRGGTPPAFA